MTNRSVSHSRSGQPARTLTRVLTCLCLWAAVMGGGFAEAPAAGDPQAAVSATTFDFGKIYEDRALTHAFVIKNTGAAPLQILEVEDRKSVV